MEITFIKFIYSNLINVIIINDFMNNNIMCIIPIFYISKVVHY